MYCEQKNGFTRFSKSLYLYTIPTFGYKCGCMWHHLINGSAVHWATGISLLWQSFIFYIDQKDLCYIYSLVFFAPCQFVISMCKIAQFLFMPLFLYLTQYSCFYMFWMLFLLDLKYFCLSPAWLLPVSLPLVPQNTFLYHKLWHDNVFILSIHIWPQTVLQLPFASSIIQTDTVLHIADTAALLKYTY